MRTEARAPLVCMTEEEKEEELGHAWGACSIQRGRNFLHFCCAKLQDTLLPERISTGCIPVRAWS